MASLAQVATALLVALGVSQPNATQVGLTEAWIRAEKPPGSPDQWNNPLNTTLRTANSTGAVNSVGVQSFDTLQAGIKANVQTINQGNFAGLKRGLLDSNPQEFFSALGSEPWGTSAQLAQEIYSQSGGQQPDTSIPVLTGVGTVAQTVGVTAQQAAAGAGSAANSAITGIWGWILRLLLTVLGIVAVMIGLYILFRPEGDGKAGDAVKLAALGA